MIMSHRCRDRWAKIVVIRAGNGDYEEVAIELNRRKIVQIEDLLENEKGQKILYPCSHLFV
jgi:hypothetical protein